MCLRLVRFLEWPYRGRIQGDAPFSDWWASWWAFFSSTVLVTWPGRGWVCRQVGRRKCFHRGNLFGRACYSFLSLVTLKPWRFIGGTSTVALLVLCGVFLALALIHSKRIAIISHSAKLRTFINLEFRVTGLAGFCLYVFFHSSSNSWPTLSGSYTVIWRRVLHHPQKVTYSRGKLLFWWCRDGLKRAMGFYPWDPSQNPQKMFDSIYCRWMIKSKKQTS